MRSPRSCGEWGIQGLKKKRDFYQYKKLLLNTSAWKYWSGGKILLYDDFMAVTYLFPRSPYDFSLSAAIFGSGDPRFRIFGQGIFRHALDTGDKPVLVEVCSKGSVHYPKTLSLDPVRYCRLKERNKEGKRSHLLDVQYR